MNLQIIPMTNDPNRSFQSVLEINGQNVTFNFLMRYNEMAGYWVMTLMDSQMKILLDSAPLLCGDFPAANILRQFGYLGIGSAVVINSKNSKLDSPDDSSWGTFFQLLWGDNLS